MPKSTELMKMLKNAMLKGNFNNLFNNLKIISADHGNCVAEFKVEDRHCNFSNALHGGCSASLVDVVSSMALLSHEKWTGSSVSINMDIKYLKAAIQGDDLIVHSNLLRAGKSLAFLEVEIRNKATNDLLVKGAHIKFLVNPSSTPYLVEQK